MKLGAEPKKMVMLGGLVVVGLYLLYTNFISSPSSGPEPARRSSVSRTSPDLTDVSDSTPAAQPNIRRAGSRARSTEEFRPALGHRRGEQKTDPMTIDPTLRLDLLAKVQAVEMQGGSRNLFAFSTPPPPPLPKEPIVPVKKADVGPVKPAPPPGPPQPPPPPPILLKYYGYSNARGESKHAFFLDGDDILVAAEGEVLKRRYKVVRIGVNSVVMEDTESKHEQTLPLQAEAAG